MAAFSVLQEAALDVAELRLVDAVKALDDCNAANTALVEGVTGDQ